MVTAYGLMGNYVTPLNPYLPPRGAMGSSGEGSHLTGTGVWSGNPPQVTTSRHEVKSSEVKTPQSAHTPERSVQFQL